MADPDYDPATGNDAVATKRRFTSMNMAIKRNTRLHEAPIAGVMQITRSPWTTKTKRTKSNGDDLQTMMRPEDGPMHVSHNESGQQLVLEDVDPDEGNSENTGGRALQGVNDTSPAGVDSRSHRSE
jgi:hypothetical protein